MNTSVIDGKLRARVRYALMAMGVRPDALDDCTQDVMLALVTTRAEIIDQTSYAFGVARNLAREEVRRAIAERATRGDMALVERTMPSHDPGALHQMERNETLKRVNSVLRALPKRGRQILTRFYFRGEGVAEICQALGITETVFRLEKSRFKAVFVGKVRRACAQHRMTT
jgi:RNA polymerase sigma factor (sigma-70 family)